MTAINTNIEFLEQVNQNLNDVVSMSAIDFAAVNEVLKRYYHNRNLGLSIQKEQNEIETKLEAMLGGLQYVDTFRQRVEHLIKTHQQVSNNLVAYNFKESLFHLHVFQSMTIEVDLLYSITSIKSLLEEIKVHLRDSSLESENFFVNLRHIQKIIHATIAAMREAGGETSNLPIPPLEAGQIRILHSLYTMESERLVLNWFLNSMPHGTWRDLLQCYESAMHRTEVNSIELF